MCFSQAVEKLVQGAESGCPSDKDKQMVLNCTRMLTRILPYIFEDQDWRGFFWSTIPGTGRAEVRFSIFICTGQCCTLTYKQDWQVFVTNLAHWPVKNIPKLAKWTVKNIPSLTRWKTSPMAANNSYNLAQWPVKTAHWSVRKSQN